MRLRRAVFALCLGLGTAFAQPSDAPDPATLAQVEALARRARTFYEQGRYDRAVAMYLEAYRKLPAAATLYNVAHIYDRKLDEPDLAADFYRRYIRSPDADPKAVERATKRIGEIKAAQESDTLDLPVPPIRVDPTPPPPARPPPGPSGRTTAGWITVAVGGAAVAGGAVMGTFASDKADRFKDVGESDRQALREDGKSQALIADILFGVGAAAVATGLVLILTDRGDDGGDSLGLAPTDGGATAVWRGRF